jgi:hypothetical protein
LHQTCDQGFSLPNASGFGTHAGQPRSPQRCTLVDRCGGHNLITTFPVGSVPGWVDCSGDHSHTLFYDVKPGAVSGGTVTSVDVRDGGQTAFAIVDGSPTGRPPR